MKDRRDDPLRRERRNKKEREVEGKRKEEGYII
jgi:hypothetical protein